jgi:DNA end-binding protein Ku
MAATIWKGAITFGLVNIPVQLESAVRDESLSFRQLRKKDLCPVQYERVCKAKDQEVPWNEIVKGFEYEKGKYVVLADEDFAKAALATSKSFDIQDFTPQDSIDPRYFDKPYFLVPERGAEKAYALLRQAMEVTETAGIGTLTMRRKQYLASIRPLASALLLNVMRFAEEVADESEFSFPAGEEVRPQELKMARELIENLREEFEPEKYTDEYQANLKKIIQAKLKGKKLNLKEAEEPDMSGVIDLVARLQESLKQSKKAPKKKPAKKKAASGAKRKSA